MNNVEVLNPVDLNEKLANTANLNAELSEEQLNSVNAGSGLCEGDYECDSEITFKIANGELTDFSYTSGFGRF